MAFQKNIDLQKQFSSIKNAEIDLDGSAMFAGTDKKGNVIVVSVTDMGEPGPGEGDSIVIWINVADIFNDQPTYAGTLMGGNIQVH